MRRLLHVGVLNCRCSPDSNAVTRSLRTGAAPRPPAPLLFHTHYCLRHRVQTSSTPLPRRVGTWGPAWGWWS